MEGKVVFELAVLLPELCYGVVGLLRQWACSVGTEPR
jgi:hypothetical protein